jgi:lysophospholipid acyltransferase (LPLAT)-like uncharacterized protein
LNPLTSENAREIDADASPPQSAADLPVQSVRGWRRILLFPVAIFARTWGDSLRVETAAPSLVHLSKMDEPMALLIWHNRLFFASEIIRRYRRGRDLYALISASRDGALLADFFDLIGLKSVRGSSSRLGREAVTAMLDELRAGHDIGITPDGPRGPRYDFKPGALIVARRARASIILLGIVYESAWQLASWDGFLLPKPFSRVKVLCTWIAAAEVKRDEASIEKLRTEMLRLNPNPPSHDKPTIV